MSAPRPQAPAGPRPHSAAQDRTIDVALELFSSRGVGATSLQMIADALGVTKAAVYHQFRSKESIVIAVAERELGRLSAWVDEAEAAGADDTARDLLLQRLIDLAFERRGAVTTLQVDPGMVQYLGRHEPFQRVIVRLFSVLLGGAEDEAAQVQAAMLSVVIGGTIAHPFVGGVDDATLRRHLLGLTRRVLQLPQPSSSS